MKRIIISLCLAFFILSLGAVTVMAGGDKVHGERGEGGVVQNCIQPGVCPWED